MLGRKLKILMVQTMNMNLGDTILADNDCFLMKKAMGLRNCDLLRYSISSRDFSQVKYVDAVVFAGGIIKCTNENFWLYMPEIIREAQKYDVPVFLSAIGVEKFYLNDERSVALKEAINLPCVKGISVRDDIETLKKDYLKNSNIKTYSVYDPAVWCAHTYKKHLDLKSKKEECVGLGITREKLFSDYGNPQIDRDYQLNFWKGIINELDKRNVKWKVFTNGDTYDEIFAKEVLAFVGHGEKVPAPKDGVSLVKDISQFTSVIAGRMHSNIVSFALQIPSIGFVWNQKLRFWGEKIGYSERFIDCDDLTSENVIAAWEKAVKEGCVLKEEYKEGVYNALKDFSHEIKYRKKDKEKINFKDCMVASSLGGIEMRYKNTNSKQAFSYSKNLGYKNFHVDVRLTSDNKLVCISKWHKDTYKILNHPKKNDENPSAITFDEFKECKYYNRFDTISFNELLSLYKKDINRRGFRLFVSVGRPNKATFLKIFDQLKEAIAENEINIENIFLRLEVERDIEYVKKSEYKINLVYHAVGSKDNVEENLPVLNNALEYCKANGIKYLYMNTNLYEKEYDELCKKYGVQFYTGTCVLTEKIISNIKNGADFVGSQYYDVKYLKRLTR
ncbi:MAG: polysaccharide pyruvyl transferase family protein [Lachnospiraceae bacterium]